MSLLELKNLERHAFFRPECANYKHGPAKQCILHILDSCCNNNLLFEVNHFCELILISEGLRRGMH